jgi:hypothetical protein
MLRVLIDRRHRNSKFVYYVRSTAAMLMPRRRHVRRIAGVAGRTGHHDRDLLERLDYCNQITAPRVIHDTSSIAEFLSLKKTVYHRDLLPHLLCFEASRRFRFLFGDVIHVPPEPTFVKSRPIDGDIANSVLMKLDSPRHFCFVTDDRPFGSKRPLLVWRGRLHLKSRKERRLDFLRQFHGARALLASEELKRPLGYVWKERHTGVNEPKKPGTPGNNGTPGGRADDKKRMMNGPKPTRTLKNI